MRGQLLFVTTDAGAVTMDCAVDGGFDEGPTLMTLRFSVAATALPAVLDVLEDWEQEGTTVEFRMREGPQGLLVEMWSWTGRLFLEPLE